MADPSYFDGGAVGRLLQSFELSKAEELWHGKCVVPATQAEGGPYDLLVRFDNPPSARQGQKVPTNVLNDLPEALIPLGDLDAILLPKQLAIPLSTFQTMTFKAFSKWRSSVGKAVRSWFLAGGEEILMIRCGPTFIEFGCKRYRRRQSNFYLFILLCYLNAYNAFSFRQRC
jgi:hypothetical protein